MENTPVWSHFYISIHCHYAGISKNNQTMLKPHLPNFGGLSPHRKVSDNSPCLQLGGFLRWRAPVDASEALQALHPALRDIHRCHGAPGTMNWKMPTKVVQFAPLFSGSMFQDQTARPGLPLPAALDGCAAHFLLASNFGWNTFYAFMAGYIAHV